MHFYDMTKRKNHENGEIYINIGWIDKDHIFNKGHIDPFIVEYIKTKCHTDCVNMTAGHHVCDLCYPGKLSVFDVVGINLHEHPVLDKYQCEIIKNAIHVDNGIGNGEIKIIDGNDIYISPQMIIHYIENHGYCPPDAYIDAVRRKINEMDTIENKSVPM
jgi:hypothetical protein